MKTTILIVEVLVGGMLILLALVFFVSSFFLGDILAIPRGLSQNQSHLVDALLLLSAVFVAIAYTIGVFLETFTRKAFGRMLNEVKMKSLEEYVRDLDKDPYVNLDNSPILKKFKDKLPEGSNEDQVRGHWFINLLKQKKREQMQEYGIMRFYVLMKSPELYQNIASQLHRFRLMRISFFAEIILILAVARQLLREVTLPLVVLSVLTLERGPATTEVWLSEVLVRGSTDMLGRRDTTLPISSKSIASKIISCQWKC